MLYWCIVVCTDSFILFVLDKQQVILEKIQLESLLLINVIIASRTQHTICDVAIFIFLLSASHLPKSRITWHEKPAHSILYSHALHNGGCESIFIPILMSKVFTDAWNTFEGLRISTISVTWRWQCHVSTTLRCIFYRFLFWVASYYLPWYLLRWHVQIILNILGWWKVHLHYFS